jgi:hypothetical protein
MKKTTLETRRQKNEHEKERWRFSSPEKCVPDHDDRFIHRCQVRLCEDNQLYMLPSICLLTIKKILHFFYTFTHAGLARKRKRKKNSTATLRFHRWREKEKCLLYHPVEEMKNLNLMKTRSQFGTSSLENIVASIESPFIRPSSTLRTKTTRRTI